MSAQAPAELKQLGRYDLVRVLGKGAMGIVYEGMDPKLHRKVAIKTILKGHMDDDDAAKEYSMRFMREAQAVARLNHAHIVQVYDFGEEGEVAYIVMEFIKGKELKNFFDANERFELKEAVRIMCELLDALDFAHESGIVHRDIKPANVMLDGQARVKLADFGVARVTDDRSAAEKTQAGTMVGTPAYMSPEQITGGSVDRRTDIFSAGIILYQFLTGEKPFTGSGAWTIAKKIIQDHPPAPSTINNTISPLFDHVVNKALSKQTETRYQTAREFSAALKRALEGRSDEDESDKTVVGSMADLGSVAKPAPGMAGARAEASTRTTATGSQEVELEFWRAIKDGNDPDDFELYVQQFPNGIYAALAKRKIAKLKGVAPEETGAKAKEQEQREAAEAAKREAEVKQKLAEEKAKLEAQLAAKEAEYKKREADAEARRQAEEKARQAADAKREAELKARQAAEEKARLEAIEKAKKEAAAQLAAKEAEYQKREAEARAAAEAEAKARKEAEAKSRQEAEALAAKARAEAEARAKKQAEELSKAKAEADARAKKEAEERAKQQAEAAKREAEAAKREADLKKKLAEAPKAKMPIGIVAGVIVAIAAAGGGAWYWYNKGNLEKQAALTAALENATKAAEELKAAQTKQLDALKALEQAREAEAKARAAGDAAALKKAQEASQRAEEEAKKQAALVKAQEEKAAKAREDMKKAQDAAKQAKVEPSKQEQVASVAPKAETPAPKAETAAPKAETPKAETAAPKAEAPKKTGPLSRSERERIADEEAARKALEKAGHAPAKAQAQTQVASAAPTTAVSPASAPASAPAAAPAKPQASENETLYQQALAMENGGDAKGAIRLYRRAARAGSGKAAKRLGEIFDRGVPGVSRDYAESLQWYETARQLGETVETAGKR